MKRLAEAIDADWVGGNGRSYPTIWQASLPYVNLPTHGPLFDRVEFAASSGGASVADMCAAAQKHLTSKWAEIYSDKTPADQAVLMIYTDYSRCAHVADFDSRLGRVPRMEGQEALVKQSSLRELLQRGFDNLYTQSSRDSDWLSDMSRLAWDLQLMNLEIPGASTPFTIADAQAILEGHSRTGTTNDQEHKHGLKAWRDRLLKR